MQGKLMQFVPEDGIYTYFRYNDKEVLMVMMNFNKESGSLDPDRYSEIIDDSSEGTSILNGEKVDLQSPINLAPRSINFIHWNRP